MRVCLSDLNMRAVASAVDLECWTQLGTFEFDFPVPVGAACMFASSTRAKPPYIAIELYGPVEPGPEDRPVGVLIVYRTGEGEETGYVCDADLHDSKNAIPDVKEVCRGQVERVPSGPHAALIGSPAWFLEGTLEIRDRSDAAIVHADEDYLWLRHSVGWLFFIAIGSIGRIQDVRAAG